MQKNEKEFAAKWAYEHDQPTIDELKAAVDNLSQCLGIAGSQSEAMQHLSALRNRKTTWCGKEENELRFIIDIALRTA